MRVEIQLIGNDPANTLVDVYSDSTRPVCRMYEEDFAEILSESQYNKFENGASVFTVSKTDLFDRAKTIFNY